jgi:hypothetical protein
LAIPIEATTPSAEPTMPARSAYPAPSAMNCWISCFRCVPTARAIPISERRSAASIVKMRTISRMPAMIEKRPRMRKMLVKALAMRSPSSTACDLTVSTPSPLPVSTGRNASLIASLYA